MPKIIVTSTYRKGGGTGKKGGAGGLLKYMGTREGVEKLPLSQTNAQAHSKHFQGITLGLCGQGLQNGTVLGSCCKEEQHHNPDAQEIQIKHRSEPHACGSNAGDQELRHSVQRPAQHVHAQELTCNQQQITAQRDHYKIVKQGKFLLFLFTFLFFNKICYFFGYFIR